VTFDSSCPWREQPELHTAKHAGVTSAAYRDSELYQGKSTCSECRWAAALHIWFAAAARVAHY